ncbi:DUF7350 domain-containing protein [Haloarchaeobius sp. HRN-SO-5]|uniref:DUF7350 domain-containing protein n=1 Tax=Haloarchaeobius sp. HRN-SO-5 TaxID=3446118 RepID=UPI003EBD6899
MQRRQLLRTLPGVAVAGLAGCIGDGDTAAPTDTLTDTATSTAAPDGPSGVYVQSFREGMVSSGTATAGDYEVGLLLAVPHTFWTVTGTERTVNRKESRHSVHLMAQVWDGETNVVLPETGVTVEVLRDGDLVSEEVIYPMLSQRMGFHYGGNFSLGGDGTFTARVSTSPLSIERLGSFAGRFDEAATAEIEFDFDQDVRDQLTVAELDAAGNPGAIRPMEMNAMPTGVAPTTESLPGTTVGSERLDDAELVLGYTGGELAGDAGSYLYVSARTRYNDLVLPMMSLDATVTRDGETVYEGALNRAVHPTLQYHYGVPVDGVRAGDEVSLTVVTPPQVGRHEGYERAFLQMDGASFTV